MFIDTRTSFNVIFYQVQLKQFISLKQYIIYILFISTQYQELQMATSFNVLSLSVYEVYRTSEKQIQGHVNFIIYFHLCSKEAIYCYIKPLLAITVKPIYSPWPFSTIIFKTGNRSWSVFPRYITPLCCIMECNGRKYCGCRRWERVNFTCMVIAWIDFFFTPRVIDEVKPFTFSHNQFRGLI